MTNFDPLTWPKDEQLCQLSVISYFVKKLSYKHTQIQQTDYITRITEWSLKCWKTTIGRLCGPIVDGEMCTILLTSPHLTPDLTAIVSERCALRCILSDLHYTEGGAGVVRSPAGVGDLPAVVWPLLAQHRPPPAAAIYPFLGIESLAAGGCLLYTSPSPRDRQKSRMPSSA